MKKYLTFFILLVFVITACSAQENPSLQSSLQTEGAAPDYTEAAPPTQVSESTPTPEPTLSPNPTPEPTPAPTPNPTPAPTPNPTPTPTPEPTPAQTETRTLKISAVGDFMAHMDQIYFAAESAVYPERYDFNPQFRYISPYIKTADFALGNLETVFAGETMRFTAWPAFNTPDEYGIAIKNAGFDFVSTANNHSNDRLEVGIMRTLDVLDWIGLGYTGTFRTQEERDGFYFREINGITFVILAYTYDTNGIPLTPGKPFLVNLLDANLIRRDIARAKELDPDIIIVLPHMGHEYELYPRQVYKNWARLMFEAGADIVLASHSHVLQPVEFVKMPDGRTCFVAYCLGNFISHQRTPPRDAGVVLNLYFEKTGNERAVLKDVSFVPTWVKFWGIDGNYDITVIPIYDVFNGTIDSGEFYYDYMQRMREVQLETTKVFLGYEIPPEDAREEYFIEWER
jgi:poly-gamma-glutamate synthesis protein (capsule biosynthesis protein)